MYNARTPRTELEISIGCTDHVESMPEKLEIITVKSITRFADDNTPIYFNDHTAKVA
ncbi:MAG: hypothetical protein R3220_00290 [Balneolaceae bacterium]|nr:hypothetical protein [Balneolaceae bacterium]